MGSEAARLLNAESFVLDAHTHGIGLLPGPIEAVYRLVTHPHPHNVTFAQLGGLGVDAIVAKAVGDVIVTRWRAGSRWAAVERQLRSLRDQADAGGCRLAGDAHAVLDAGSDGRPAVVLGLEGGDVISEDPTRLDQLYETGVRVVGLVHYVDNGLGTVCLPWQGWLPIPLPNRRRVAGLTALGAEVISGMNELGMIVDLAHADRATTLAACERTTAPVVSSHTGARALSDFARFIDDDEARAIAATGGLVGLWPFHYRGRGVVDLDDFARHASYLAELVGAEHLCIGTDMNGVSGLMRGYRGEEDLPLLTDALLHTGFDVEEVRGVVGGNFLRVFDAVATRPA